MIVAGPSRLAVKDALGLVFDSGVKPGALQNMNRLPVNVQLTVEPSGMLPSLGVQDASGAGATML